ncbi:unannotated protein [freshwater metagenome]|uniref:Unannotated protein n=1 Tax=freshwater metagenome TaxID=449393 RepID=A0A6J6S901_9ZZZZ
MVYCIGLNFGSSIAIATLYFIGPLGQLIRFAFSFTTESKPVERIAPNHSESTSPRSIFFGASVVRQSNCLVIARRDQPNARPKSFPVPAGITVKGIARGTTDCMTRCASPSPPTATTPWQPSPWRSRKFCKFACSLCAVVDVIT